MEHIIEPNESFDFTKCALMNPIAMQGSSYFTRVQYNGSNMYIQTPKCLTKQGIVKNNKKMYIELMFDNSHESFISWLENLETTFQDLIYDKNDSWFQTPLEKMEIESSFVSPIKVYKSGKNYLVRVPIKVNINNLLPVVKIYNENTDELCVEDFSQDSYVICIIEILGIRFTTRNFQIEMEVKQMMTINQDKFLHNCLIKKKYEGGKEKETFSTNETVRERTSIDKEADKEPDKETDKEDDKEDDKEADKVEETDKVDKGTDKETDNETDKGTDKETDKEADKGTDDFFIDSEEIKEVTFSDPLDTLESITLKNPNEVFYEIYKRAKEKAKIAKKEALRAVLEAKNIKKTYNLNIQDEDDSDEEDEEDEEEEEYEQDQ